MADKGILRNRLKIRAANSNAALFLEIQKQCGNFDRCMWQVADHKPIVGQWKPC